MRSRLTLRPRVTAVAVTCLGMVLASGCAGGGSAGRVTGKVTAGGKPLVWGTVTLVDAKGQYRQGVIDLNGQYGIDNVPAGPVKIGVVSENPDPGGTAGGGKGGGAGAGAGAAAGRGGKSVDPREARGFRPDTSGAPAKPPPGAWFPIDAKFSDPMTSGLTGEVKAGKESELNIELK
jgi:hypothetical protein